LNIVVEAEQMPPPIAPVWSLLPSDDDAAHREAVGLHRWARRRSEEAELLAGTNDLAVEIGGRLTRMFLPMPLLARVELRRPLPMTTIPRRCRRWRSAGGSGPVTTSTLGPGAAAAGERVQVGRYGGGRGSEVDAYAVPCRRQAYRLAADGPNLTWGS
jgi:hypothetical protein